jgi:hypothetical protein
MTIGILHCPRNCGAGYYYDRRLQTAFWRGEQYFCEYTTYYMKFYNFVNVSVYRQIIPRQNNGGSYAGSSFVLTTLRYLIINPN